MKEKEKLRKDEIHVWHAFAGQASSLELRNVLTNDEIIRARRYYFHKDRENFIISRGVLRSLIAHYLNISPEHVILHFNKYGKPFLKNQGNLKFNVSHSNGLLLFAFARSCELGIDVEFMRHELSDLEVAGRFFSFNEMLAISALPEEARKVAFFNCWTRKEAYIKAKGKGLSIPLDSFDVSVGDTPELLCVNDDPKESTKWKIFNLDIAPNYRAALAVKGNPRKIKHFGWNGEILRNSSISRSTVIPLK